MSFFNKIKSALVRGGIIQPKSAEEYNMLTNENGVSYRAIRFMEEFNRRTQTPALILNPIPNSSPGITDSKFGGVPYWQEGREYPLDSDGEPMVLLTQINFAQASACSPLPESGLLQFFISANSFFGCDYKQPDVQKDFRIVWHEEINSAVTEQQILSMNIPICGRGDNIESPVHREIKLELAVDTMYMDAHDYRSGDEYEAVKHLFCKTEEDENYFGNMPKADIDYIFGYRNNGSHMLGYPCFSQEDPRNFVDEGGYFDTLLLQVDEFSHQGEDYVIWGDCGVGNFFINAEALEKRDFSRVLYSWDC